MLEQLLKKPALQAFSSQLDSSSLLIERLWQTPKALLSLLAQKATNKNILFISAKRDDRLLQSFSFFLGKEIFDLPAWETLPGENIAPSSDISGKRLSLLFSIAKSKNPVVVHATLQSLLQKTLSPKTLSESCLFLKKGEDTSFSHLLLLMEKLGYVRRPLASDKGEFAVRGGIIDIFPTSSLDPYRIEFFGDTIESIRTYDPIAQKSIAAADSLFLCPASEWESLQKEKKTSSLLEFLGSNTLIILDDLLALEDEAVSLQSLPGMHGRLIFSFQDFVKQIPNFTHLFFLDHKVEELSNVQLSEKKGRDFYSGKKPFQPLSFDFFHTNFTVSRFHHPFLEIPIFFSRFENQSAATKEEILLSLQNHPSVELHLITSGIAEEESIRKTTKELKVSFPKNTTFEQGYLPSGFALADKSFALLPSTELTHRYKVRREPWRHSYHSAPSDFHQLTPGDTVVHIHHGIGKFIGIETQKNHLGQEAEFFTIEYADNGKLSVPVTQSHFISRYIGANETTPNFSVLGTKRWHKTYADAQNAVLGYAQDLLKHAAERTIHPGYSFPSDTPYMQMFEDEFPFPETEDQLKAIAAIKEDMMAPKAMDRLVCGDVGYGKTEVAMRAAFKAAFEGKKQVAVLVPTTLLAEQHFENFQARMANFPVKIAILSRFCSSKQVKKTLDEIKEGTIDIVIGTHRLISKDVQFKDLGLLIIDEEQRFGVRAKEAIKLRKVGIDCLTLSATPIPRTLYMSLIGIRQISTINTPPQDRLPIKSIVAEKEPSVIEQALLREFARGGQVFFIHNRVETLPKIYGEIQKIVPQAKIVMGHGQMDPDEMEMVFSAFKSGKADVLLSTTIVENGIDIPNANTILIDRADQFGMADLYQLRGRVGRSNQVAYSYFLIPKSFSLSEIAYKRLTTLAQSSGYGSGMKIALRDLELRGAGNILGTEQSGEISAVGFHLYCKMLKKAIEATSKQRPLDFLETKMEFSLEARLPEEYVNEAVLRMEFYYRLGNAATIEEIQEIELELKDRFGPLPKGALLLCTFSRLKIFATSLRISSLKFAKMTLQAEKPIGSSLAKETFSIPSPFPHLHAFEQKVMELLKQWKPKNKIH
jgi:transcription-repair coupling factor (superfamily II helicase)